MIVRRMSAQQALFFGLFLRIWKRKASKNGPNRHALISPKAEVRGSNPFGRAIKYGLFTSRFGRRGSPVCRSRQDRRAGVRLGK